MAIVSELGYDGSTLIQELMSAQLNAEDYMESSLIFHICTGLNFLLLC